MPTAHESRSRNTNQRDPIFAKKIISREAALDCAPFDASTWITSRCFQDRESVLLSKEQITGTRFNEVLPK